MSAPEPIHPDESELRAFSLGQIADDRIASISDHLTDCPECCERIDRLDTRDTLLDRIREAAARENKPSDSDLRKPAVLALRRTRLRTLPGRPIRADLPTEADRRVPGLPRVIGGYEILAEVGRGGMGVVYKAKDVRLNRLVAVKMVLEGRLASEEQHLRFRLEAELAARVQHPNIVQVHDVGTHDGLPFLVMEWIESGSLADRIGDPIWPPLAAARLVETLARAIQVLHDRGVIHRDLKPANVLLVDEGSEDDAGSLTESGSRILIPKVADFGTARLSRTDGGLTRTGIVLGTPQYMAPEQARGATALIGPGSDVYALGAILYELLAGSPPFTGEDPVALLDAVATREPTPPRRLRPGVPRDLEAICLRCLEKEPHRRYPSAIALAEDLARFRIGQPIAIRPIGAATRITRWCRRRPAIATLCAAAAAFLLISSPLVTWKWLEADGLRRRGLRDLYIANVRLASQAWDRGQVRPMMSLLDEAAKGRPGDADLRKFEWYHLRHLGRPRGRTLGTHTYWVTSVAFRKDGSLVASAGHDGMVKLLDPTGAAPPRILAGHEGAVYGVAFSPDGSRLATCGGDGTVRIWDAASGTELHRFQHGPIAWGVAFSPDGTTVASGGEDRTIRLWNAATGQPLKALKGHGAQVVSVDFSPDGRRLVSGAWDRSVRVWDLEAGRERVAMYGHSHFITTVAFGPDGKRVASAGWDQTARLWDADSGRELHNLRGHTGLVAAVAFSREGGRLASASEDGTARIWETATGAAIGVIKGHERQISGVAFRPDGMALVTGSRDHSVRLWDLGDLGDLADLKGHTDAVSGVAYSPDGRSLASSGHDGTVRVWNPATGEQTRTFKGHTGRVNGVAFAPDAGRLASVGHDGTVRIWDIASGAQTFAMLGHTGRVTGVAFSPDGSIVASAGGEDRTIRFWDVRTGKSIRVIDAHKAGVNAVTFSPDGSRLASASEDQTAGIWDATTGNRLLTLTGHYNWVTGVAFRPDGLLLATSGHDGTVRTWDSATGRPVLVMKGHTSQAWSVAFSPDGSRLASAGYDRTVRLWDASDGQELLTLDGHHGWVNGVAFRPDGRALASAGEDRLVRIAEVEAPPPEASRLRSLRDWAFHAAEGLHASLVRKEDVKAAILDHTSLDDESRKVVLDVVESYRPDPSALNNEGWTITRSPNETPEAYARALLLAEESCRLDPLDPSYAGTLGAVQIRLGRYREGVENLARAESLFKARGEGPHPCDLAFAAIGEARLKQHDRARAAIERLRQRMAQDAWSDNPDARTCAAEAEAVVRDESAK